MSEDDARTAESAASVPQEPASFGARLSAARERAGISVTEVAGRLRLHPNQVRALEQENLGALPEAAYVRGFLRSYARLVGIDPAPLVGDFNAKATPSGASVVDGMTRTNDYSPVKAAAQEQASRRLVLSVAVVALIALGVVGWYATRSSDVPTKASDKPAAVTTPLPAEKSAAPAAMPAAVVAAAAPDAAADAAPAPAEQGAVEPAPRAVPLLSLAFNGVSWVEVTDANGNVLLSQLARAGETYQPDGTPPLAVVIGDASKATITVRGESMSLESVARSNVARFTVK